MDETSKAEQLSYRTDELALRKCEAQIRLLRSKLKEVAELLVAHHDASLCTFRGVMNIALTNDDK